MSRTNGLIQAAKRNRADILWCVLGFVLLVAGVIGYTVLVPGWWTSM